MIQSFYHSSRRVKLRNTRKYKNGVAAWLGNAGGGCDRRNAQRVGAGTGGAGETVGLTPDGRAGLMTTRGSSPGFPGPVAPSRLLRVALDR